MLIGAAPAKDWRQTVGVAPTGGFTVGNPAAKVKLVEYLSYTCPHCGHFVEESKVALHDGLVRRGVVRVETRSAVRDPYDLAAWMVARCGGPRRFAALNAAIFASQAAWMDKGQAYATANLESLKALPQLAQIAKLIEETGLGLIGARAGVTPVAMKACLASDVQLKAVLAMTEGAFKKIPGTPGFEINGVVADNVADWGALEPKLRAAGAR
jgi:protein-disulfide isomerase